MSAKALEIGKIWEGLWPVLIGVGLALGLRRLGWPLPRVPAGDSIVAVRSRFRRLMALGPAFETLRRPPAAMAGGGRLFAFDYPRAAGGGRLRKLDARSGSLTPRKIT